MGVRIRYEFEDLKELRSYRVDIVDADYGGSVNEVLDGQGFELSYERDGDEFLQPIKGSSCRVRMYDRGEEFWSSFINNLSTAFDQEFHMVIYRDTGSGFNLWWVGNCLPSLIEIENETGAKEFEIQAVDGLARLRDIRFTAAIDSSLTSSSYFRVAQAYAILHSILSLTNHSQFWGGNDNYVKYFGHWKYDDNNSYYELLDRTRVPLRIFTEQNDDISRKNDTPISAYNALIKLLKLFNLRIMLSNGSWMVYHVGVLHDSSTHFGAHCFYRKSGTPSSTSPYRYNHERGSTSDAGALGGNFAEFDGNGMLQVMNGGKFSWFPALSRAEITAGSRYDFDNIQKQFTTDTLNAASAPMSETVDLGVIDGGSGRSMLFAFGFKLKGAGQAAPVQLRNKWKLRIRIKVIAGSYRLWDNSNNLDDLVWTTGTPSHSVYIDLPIQNSHNIEVVSPELPWSSEDVEVDYTFDIIDSQGNSYGSSLFEYAINWASIDVLINGEPVLNTRYQVDNPEITHPYENSVALVMDEFPLDAAGTSSFNKTLSFNTTGTTFEKVDVWGADHTDNRNTAVTLLQDAMAVQDYPRRRYIGPFDNESGAFNAHMVFDYDGSRWVLNSVRFDAMNCRWDGEWFGIEWYAKTDAAVPDNGRGYEFDGPDMVKPKRRVKRPYEFFGTIKEGFYGETIGGSGADYGDTITTLTIESATQSLLKSGDTIMILDSDTLEKVAEVQLTSDVDASDTSISFSSDTIDHNIPVGAKVMLKGSEGFATPMLRTDEIQLGGETITEIHQVSFVFAATQNRYVTPVALNTETNVPFTSPNFLFNDPNSEFSLSSSDGVITYNGSQAKYFEIYADAIYFIDSSAPLGTVTIEMGVKIGGVALDYTVVNPSRSRDEPHQCIINCPQSVLENGDTVEFYFKNGTTNKEIFFSDLKIGLRSVQNVNI